MDIFDGVGLNEDFCSHTGSVVKAKSSGGGILTSGGATHAVPSKADAKGGEAETRKADVVTIDGRGGGQDHVAGLMDTPEESSIREWLADYLFVIVLFSFSPTIPSPSIYSAVPEGDNGDDDLLDLLDAA
jgi:hypothetical protein